MPNTDPIELFFGESLHDVLEQRRTEVLAALHSMSMQSLDSKEFIPEHTIPELRILHGQIPYTIEKCTVDASKFEYTAAWFERKACPVPGLRVHYYVPYEGPRFLLECRPQRFPRSSLKATIDDQHIVFSRECLSQDKIPEMSAEVRKTVTVVRECLDDANSRVRRFNEFLPGLVSRASSETASVESQMVRLGFSKAAPHDRPADVAKERASGRTFQGFARDRHRHETYDIGLSFAGEDRAYVRRVAEKLARRGIRVFYDEFEQVSLWGKNLLEEFRIIFGDKCRFVVMVISKHYVSKRWPAHERRSAQARALCETTEYILPVRLDRSVVPGMVDSVSYLWQPTVDDLVARILEKLGQQ